MLRFKPKSNYLLRAISIILIHALILSNVAFASPSRDTLSPMTPFSPLCRVVNGIRSVMAFTMEERNLTPEDREKSTADYEQGLSQLTDGRKAAFRHMVENDRGFNLIAWLDKNAFIPHEILNNCYDSFVSKIEELGINPIDFTGVITIEVYYEGKEVVINIIDNGKSVRMGKDGLPVVTPKTRKHFGLGIGGVRTAFAKSQIEWLGGRITWKALRTGTWTEIRIPRNRIPQTFQIDEGERMSVSDRTDEIDWDRETTRSVRAGETPGKSLINRTAFYYISQLIGQDLNNPPSGQLSEPVSPENRAQALIDEIRRHVDPAELEVSKTRGDLDPILRGFELDKLRYRDGAYELPIYREGVKRYYYRFHTDEKGDLDWVIPVGGGKDLYVECVDAVTAEKSEIAIRSMRHRSTHANVRSPMAAIVTILNGDENRSNKDLQRIKDRVDQIRNRLIELTEDTKYNYPKAIREISALRDELIALEKEMHLHEHEIKDPFREILFFGTQRIITLLQDKIDFAHKHPGKIDKVCNIGQLIRGDKEFLAVTDKHLGEIDDVEVQNINSYRLLEVLETLVWNATIHGRDPDVPDQGVNVKVSVRERHGYCEIEVKDDGIGTAASLLEEGSTPGKPRIYELGSTTRGDNEEGGLGMALAWHFVKDHNGTIDIKSPTTTHGASEPGKGTTVTIRLSLKGSQESSPQAQAAGSAKLAPRLVEVHTSPSRLREFFIEGDAETRPYAIGEYVGERILRMTRSISNIFREDVEANPEFFVGDNFVVVGGQLYRCIRDVVCHLANLLNRPLTINVVLDCCYLEDLTNVVPGNVDIDYLSKVYRDALNTSYIPELDGSREKNLRISYNGEEKIREVRDGALINVQFWDSYETMNNASAISRITDQAQAVASAGQAVGVERSTRFGRQDWDEALRLGGRLVRTLRLIRGDRTQPRSPLEISVDRKTQRLGMFSEICTTYDEPISHILGLCSEIIIHNTSSGGPGAKKTISTHSQAGDISRILEAIDAAERDPEMGVSDSIEVVVAGTAVNSVFFNKLIAEDRAEMALNIFNQLKKNRETIRARLKNYKNVHLFFPDYIDMGVNLDFDTPVSICQLTYVLNKHAADDPVTIEAFGRFLEKAVSAEQTQTAVGADDIKEFHKELFLLNGKLFNSKQNKQFRLEVKWTPIATSFLESRTEYGKVKSTELIKINLIDVDTGEEAATVSLIPMSGNKTRAGHGHVERKYRKHGLFSILCALSGYKIPVGGEIELVIGNVDTLLSLIVDNRKVQDYISTLGENERDEIRRVVKKAQDIIGLCGSIGYVLDLDGEEEVPNSRELSYAELQTLEGTLQLALEAGVEMDNEIMEKTLLIRSFINGGWGNFELVGGNTRRTDDPKGQLRFVYVKFAGIKVQQGISILGKPYGDEKDTEIIPQPIPEIEQLHAIEFVRQADEKPKPAFIALGTSWIKGYEKDRFLQYDALNPLITSLRQFCGDHIEFIDGDDEHIARRIGEIKQATPDAQGIVLAGDDTIGDLNLQDDANVLLAGVDNKHLTIDSYIRLMEMLNVTLELFHMKIKGEDIDEQAIIDKHKSLGIRFHKGIITFEPDAEPMDYEILKEIYKLQRFA